MNLDVKVDKNTCFYYWTQAVCGWDTYSIIAERVGSDEHYHVVIDDFGNVIFSEWRKNH